MPKEYNAELLEKFSRRIHENEKKTFQPYATLSNTAIRRYPDYGNNTIRPEFSRDADRIIHSLSFGRFSDKTQVFFWIDSDIFQHRLMHVQLVAKIARMIAKILGLNDDLVEAISLGHDIGHCPFGHDGEEFLSKLCHDNNIGYFHHNHESIWFLQEIEMQNLSLQTLDGILCHNGENHERKLEPDREKLSWDTLDKEMEMVTRYKSGKKTKSIKPKTMEGALVRFVDTISYISRDVREAEYLKIVSFSDLPQNVKSTLGESNREIIGTLITDLIENSLDKPFIGYSEDVSAALQELYQFNYENLYNNEGKYTAWTFLKESFNSLWEHYLDDLQSDRRDSEIFTEHFEFNLRDIQTRYPGIKTLEDYPYFKLKDTNPNVVVRDFLAGMTDTFFLKMTKKIRPDLEFKKIQI